MVRMPARMGPRRQESAKRTVTAPTDSSNARGPRSLDTLLRRSREKTCINMRSRLRRPDCAPRSNLFVADAMHRSFSRSWRIVYVDWSHRKAY